MKKKFKLLTIGSSDLITSLEELEVKGWELISFTAIGGGDFACVFKRINFN